MAYASPQSAAIVPSGLRKKLRPSYVDDLRAQYGTAGVQVAAQKARDLDAKIAKDNRKMQRQTMALQERQAGAAMGIKAAGLGLNMMDKFGGTTFSIPGINSKFNMGNMLGGAGLGYGLYSALNPKASTGSKVAAGLAGGALSLLF